MVCWFLNPRLWTGLGLFWLRDLTFLIVAPVMVGGVTPNTLRYSALGLFYTAAEYSGPVWPSSRQDRHTTNQHRGIH